MYFFVYEDVRHSQLIEHFDIESTKVIRFNKNDKKYSPGRKANLRSIKSILNEKINLSSSSECALVVSNDIHSPLLRDIVHCANKLNLKTVVLKLDLEQYVNDKNGWDSHIADEVLHAYELDYNMQVSNRRGNSTHRYIGRKNYVDYDVKHIFEQIGITSNDRVIYCGNSKIKDSSISKHAMRLGIKILTPSGFIGSNLNIPSGMIAFIHSICRIEISVSGNNISLKAKEAGIECLGSTAIKVFLENISFSKEHAICNQKIDGAFFETIDNNSLGGALKNLVSKDYIKKPYNTLGFLIKKGDNLLKTLYWYPKLLGCGNHYIIKVGDEEADVYARFALTETPALAKLHQRRVKGEIEEIYSVENGFTSFPTIAISGDSSSLNILSDKDSIYFNGIIGSSTEDRIHHCEINDETLLSELRYSISLMVENNISKYNHSNNFTPDLPGDSNHKVLIVDQRFGDKSISFANANAATFSDMLNDAISDYPESDIIIKVHPDALTGKAKGHFSNLDYALPKNVYLYSEDVNSVSLVKSIDAVYVVSSQLGLEAVFQGKKVYSYGVSIYSGWGLTEDRCFVPRRYGITKKPEELFYSLYIHDTRYIDPLSGDVIDFDGYIKSLAKYIVDSRSLELEIADFYQDLSGNYLTPLGSQTAILKALSNLHSEQLFNVATNLYPVSTNPLVDLVKSLLLEQISALEAYNLAINTESKLIDVFYFSLIVKAVDPSVSPAFRDFMLMETQSPAFKERILECL